MPNFQLFCGDSLDQLKNLPDNSVDSIVCDPPYGISFMGKKWDYDVPSVDVWKECLRVLKPGGHLLAFAGTRTQHRMAVNIEDAGFEVRDMLAWAYGSGFPKSLDVSKAIDKAAGAEREVVGEKLTGKARTDEGWKGGQQMVSVTAPATPAARQWEGWGTALKPALEPITLARKPVSEKTVARNVLTWGTGGINIDGCRVGSDSRVIKGQRNGQGGALAGSSLGGVPGGLNFKSCEDKEVSGRFPANLIHDGNVPFLGEASRFFYSAKASKKDRNEGLEGFEDVQPNFARETNLNKNGDGTPRNKKATAKNPHPTVKPTDLMRYLCRLITPPGGTVLDPFMGSGSTGKAAMLEGFNFIGVDLSQEYVDISRARIEHARNQAEEKAQAELLKKQKPKLF